MLKKNVVDVFSRLPFVQDAYKGICTIFMLHRVDDIDSNRLPANENMKVSPKFLDELIQYLLKNNFEIITLDDLHDILNSQKHVQNKIVFTFDDGYKDNLIKALPIFEKFNVPMAVYVSTSFPDGNAAMWWYALEDIILINNKISLSDGSCYVCENIEDKNKTFLLIRDKVLNLEQKNIKLEFENLLSDYPVDWQCYVDALALSWSQVKELASNPLVTIGNHTVNHYALNQLSAEEVCFEIQNANCILEQRTNLKIKHFAYPFGSCAEVGQREYDLVKKLHFKTATSTRRGNIFLKHNQYLECLPRIMLTEHFDMSSISRIRKTRIVTI